MVYDLIYNGFLLTSIYFTLDLLNKYNKKEVKTQNDIKIYFATKGILLLDTYNSTKSKICGVLDKCKKQDEDEYKVVILTKSDDIIQCYLCYEKEDYYLDGDDVLECLEKDDVKLVYIKNPNNGHFLQIKAEELKGSFVDLKNKLENLNYQKIFLNVQLLNDGQEYDLNNLVEKYYVSGNVILNKDFIKFIVPEIEDLKEDYKINIIDKEIVMFELNNNNSIEIVDDGYKINKTMKQ